jgi:hypothetical protein
LRWPRWRRLRRWSTRFKLPLRRNAFERLDEEGGVAKLRLVADGGYGDLFTQKVKRRFPDSGGR